MSAVRTAGGEPTALPRWLAAIIVGTIALASGVALVWPMLPFGGQIVGPTNVGVIRAQIDGAGMAGRIGAFAPDFEWNAPDGTTSRLSDLRGKVVVINFWATWCLPCRQEMPAIQRVAASEPDVVVLEVDLQESGEKVRSFLDQLGLDRLVPLLDVEAKTTERYAVLSFPTTFFVGTDGVIKHLRIGQMTDDDIRTGIAKAR